MTSNAEKVYKSIKDNASKGLSTTVLTISGSGRTYAFKKFQKTSSTDDGFVTIYINADELPKKTSVNFYNQLLIELVNVLVESEDNPSDIPNNIMQALQLSNEVLLISTIKKTISKILEKHKELIIMIDDLSKLENFGNDFFNSLRNIRFVNKESISFAFLDKIEMLDILTEDKTDDLYNYLTESIIYYPLPKDADYTRVFNEMAAEHKPKEKEKYVKKLYEMTHGHPALLKYSIIYLAEHNNLSDIKSICGITQLNRSMKKIISGLSQEDLSQIVTPKKKGKSYKKLLEIGLLQTDDKGNTTSPTLLKYFITTELKGKTRKSRAINTNDTAKKIILKDGIVSINETPTSEPLSNREYKILKYFDQHRNKVVSREQLGKVIWGGKLTEEYSDWAIDQSISRLRKKLGDNAYKPEYLKTIRGRGFILKD